MRDCDSTAPHLKRAPYLRSYTGTCETLHIIRGKVLGLPDEFVGAPLV